jgi:hypothetical protein
VRHRRRCGTGAAAAQAPRTIALGRFVTFYRLNSAGRPMITMRLVGPDIKYADIDYCFLRTR